ncbi:hypothetical protein GCM10009795_005500 [Nocardioides hankookensis]|uniref:histidine kinase n=1 Tax=Nocardioides hankookensis TaxID=443157 RepID=A0ABW1LHN7_9ACTN
MRHARFAVVLATITWALAVVAICMLLMGRPTVDQDLWFFAVDVSVACVYGTVAAVILSRRAHPVPWLLGLAAVGGGLAAFGHGYAEWSDLPGGLPPHEQIAQLQGIAWVPGTLALFLVVPWLVRDHPLGWEWVGLAIGTALTLSVSLEEVTAGGMTSESPYWAAIAVGLAAALVVEFRHRHGPQEERSGLGWLAVGTALTAIAFVPVLSPGTYLPYWLTPVIHLVAQTVFPAAVLVVVLRNRMWGLRLTVSRAVLAGLLTALLLVGYVAVTALLSPLLPGDELPQLVAAAAVAVAVQPARIMLAKRVHRLVFGDAVDSGRVVHRLGSQLVSSASIDDLLAGLTSDIGESMRLESVTVVSDALPPVRWGEASGPGTEVDLRHRGELVGLLQVSALPGELLSARDLATLHELATVVAAAVVIGRGAVDLEELRSRLAAARLEERRVLRREIHDGLGPALAGIGLGLQGARNLLRSDPDAGVELLERLQSEVESAALSVRSLSHHLLPPVLDELGLVPALAELAGRFHGENLSVALEADRFDDLDPRVATAAYGIASEALTNVSRHARADHCRIVARRHPAGSLLLVIADDGAGQGTEATPGVGTHSMRERADEQGGSLEVRDRIGGGTEVVATLPLVDLG